MNLYIIVYALMRYGYCMKASNRFKNEFLHNLVSDIAVCCRI